MHQYATFNKRVHRLIPSRYPPVSLFDWAESAEELEQIAQLEGLTNERLLSECGNITLVAKEDWVSGPGSTPLMAAFTHPGESRFADGRYGVYYAADSLNAAIAETVFHRQRFLSASNEPICLIQMREYIGKVKKPLVDINSQSFNYLLNPNPAYYSESQRFAQEIRAQGEWGLLYPSVRKTLAHCVAIFRPPALTLPIPGKHLDYIWDGSQISEIRIAKPLPQQQQLVTELS